MEIKVITICGSMRYAKEMMKISEELELKKGYAVIQCVYNVDGLKYEGIDANILDKSGAWYAYKGEKIGQGKENVKMYLKANPKLKDELEKQVRDFYSKKEVIDETTEVVEE